MSKLKHTRIGIISFIVSVMPIVYMAIQFMIDYNVPPEKNITSNITYSYIMPLFLFIVSSIGLVLGLVGLFENNSRKVLPIISTVISGLITLCFVIGFSKN
jgi:hypothetical protein